MKKKQYAAEEPILGEDIKSLRKQLGCTQQELADYIQVTKKTIERWESGKKPITGPIVLLSRILDENPVLFSYYQIPPREEPLRLWYMYRRKVCTIIDVNEAARRVQIHNYTEKLQFRAFGRIERPDFKQYETFLESRCFPRERDHMKWELRKLGLPFYDPLMIIEKTEGRMAEDEFWIRIEREKA